VAAAGESGGEVSRHWPRPRSELDFRDRRGFAPRVLSCSMRENPWLTTDGGIVEGGAIESDF
jgi:hypothetical protein